MLDIEQADALTGYLRQAGHITPDESPTIRVLPGGVSSRTVYVERASGEAWVLKQSLPKLRVAVDWFSDPARIHNEAEALRWLAALTPAGSVPALIFEDHDRHILAMQAVSQPHANWKTMLLGGNLQPEHAAQFGRLLAAIHRGAYQRRDEIERAFGGHTFFESLRVEPYYRFTASRLPESAAFYSALIEDTLSRLITLVHGDYSPKNILVHNGRLVLLDHEVAHPGDPAFDLGFSLTHLLSKAHHIPHLRTEFAQAAIGYWSAYNEGLGDLPWRADLEARAVRHTLGCLLARVDGRSPLEYLTPEERERQRRVVLGLLAQPPVTLPEVIDRFIKGLS